MLLSKHFAWCVGGPILAKYNAWHSALRAMLGPQDFTDIHDRTRELVELRENRVWD